ncbi:MAG TPA: N-acetyl-gamma-glutamyl-phosphate reductase [Anaeromyxobacteraceae bacterium]|jgi:N-acetyl-gamma-glutamyl-phosphate reductase|nr:N-acetyl-gamma-glutamyl-phosphate reductase [Anaeromyxobacteraceae bacterium]
MHSTSAAVVGASGYAGLELTRILSRHPRVRLDALFSDRWSDEVVGARLPLDGPAAALRYRPQAAAAEVDSEVAFLATPAEVSLDLAPRLLARGVRVVDLSGAFRLGLPELYPTWYGFPHHQPELLASAPYGLPELCRAEIVGAKLVSNPGCYATAIALALAPLVKAGACLPDGITVTALSGVSGAGRKAAEDYSFCEVAEDVRTYRIGRHQHVPEIERTVARHAGRCGPLSFTPVLAPIRRGILATCTLRLAPGVGQADLARAYAGAYADEPFVRILAADKVKVADVARTNRCHLGATADARTGLAVAVSAIDNLVKGAAGQAVQAMNAAWGWDETLGLDLLGG